MTARKHRPQPSFFDLDNVYQQISEMGDAFETLNRTVDWEIFRPVLNEVFAKPRKGPGGRPPYDYVFMFKIIVLQNVYNLPDGRTQYDILNRLDFRRFLGLDFSDAVPDEKTIWNFRDELVDAGVILDLFNCFKNVLAEKGLILKGGVMVDATIIPAPVQHMTKDEKEAIERGEEPERWTSVLFVTPKAKPRGRSEEGGDCPVTPKAKSRGRNEEENRNRLPARRS